MPKRHNVLASVILALLMLLALLPTLPASAQIAALPRWQRSDWWRNTATLDLDFANDRYHLNGTQYSGVNNFITGAGATFTRAGAANTTATGAPFYLGSNQVWVSRAVSTDTYQATGAPFYLSGTQAFSSRASVTNNVTSTIAPFYTNAGQSWVSRNDGGVAKATYFDSTGTLQTIAASTARSATYSYNGSSWVANSGTLIEPLAKNSIRNNSGTGVVAFGNTELTTNGTFTTSCSGATCTGWSKTTAGTATVSFVSGTATLTGDGTNAASIYQAITTTSGTIYTISVTTGAGTGVTVQAGTGAGGAQLFAALAGTASTTNVYSFLATSATSYVQINNTNAGAATVTTVSVKSAGHPPTNWSTAYSNSGSVYTGLTSQIVGGGVDSGISYVDIRWYGTPTTTAATGGAFAIFETSTGVAATIGQTWTNSAYLKMTAGSTANLNELGLRVRENTSGGLGTSSATEVSVLGVSSTWQRFAVTRTFNNTAAGFALPWIAFGFTAGQAIDITLRIGLPQLEQNAFATSPIATTAAAVTRNADVYNQQPASYFDNTGTMNFADANVARDNHNSTSPYADLGTLIEPAATNQVTNNMMVGAVAADGVGRTTNGTFAACTGTYNSSNTVGTATQCSWTIPALANLTTQDVFSSGSVQLTGDGTNAASIYQSVTTISGYVYTIAVTAGAGAAVTVQAGTSAGDNSLLAATSAPASATTNYQFTATGTTSYIQINNASASAATVTTVSVQSAGKMPTNWAVGLTAIVTVVGTGTENGINYIDISFSGSGSTAFAINLDPNASISALQNQNWTLSSFLKLTSGSLTNMIVQLNMLTENASAGLNNYSTSPTPTNAALGTQRITVSSALTDANMTYVLPRLRFQPSGAFSFTLRIGMPQLELGSTATQPIPTFGSAVTRTADVYTSPFTGTYFDNTGTQQTATTSVARDDHNYTSPYADLGTLIEPASTNAVPNSAMAGAVASLSIAPQTISSITDSSGVATVTTAQAHGLTAQSSGQGSIVTISGATPSNYNGTFMVASVPSSTTFTYTMLTDPAANATVVGSYTAVTGGTLPTPFNTWGYGGGQTAGLMHSVVATGTEFGMNYIDIRFYGTSTAGSFSLVPHAIVNVAASPGQAWSVSEYTRLVGGTTTNVTSLKIGENFFDSSSSTLSGVNGSASLPTSTLARYTLANSTAPATTAYERSQMSFIITNGAAIDMTVRFYGWQEEQSAYVTSYIPTNTVANARAADVYTNPSGGTYFDNTGTMQTAGPNVPRLDHSPVSPYAPLGVLIEENRTNLIANSSGTTGEGPGSTPTTYVTTAVPSPDGVTDFLKCVEAPAASGSGGQTCGWVISMNPSTTYIVSMFLKAAERSALTLLAFSDTGNYSSASVDLSAGTITTCASTIGSINSIQKIGTNIYRVSITFTTTASPSGSYINIKMSNVTPPTGCAGTGYTGDGASGLYVWGVQMEAGAYPTSYIPTSGSTATRSTDVFTVPTTATGANGAWFAAGIGTLIAYGEYDYLGAGQYPGLADLWGSSGNTIGLYTDSAGDKSTAIILGGAVQYSGSPGGKFTAGVLGKQAIAYATNNVNAAMDGTLGTLGTSATIPTVTKLDVGAEAANPYGEKHVKRITYFQTREPDPALAQTYTQ